MHHGKDAEHHPLIPGGQVIQHFFRFFPLQLHIIGDYRRKIVVGILPALPIRHVCLHAEKLVLDLPYRFIRGHRQDVNGKHQVLA